ncbi:hypothetical protein DDZ15_09760 [Rhodohalobacter mucosus]|uniref:Uncharacterized protein n=1 Tax=Rhodohalobacter mucosus TaxID=2079485 RepID=A0A316TNE1_9BACT|nr:hypothetical protein DDZ15_09760 [Rhodohalobacter mucosus]
MKHFLETSLKPAETLTPVMVTFMFQESFKIEDRKYLNLLYPIKTKINLKQQCFHNCFNKNGHSIRINVVFSFLKQITATATQTGLFKKSRFNI